MVNSTKLKEKGVEFSTITCDYGNPDSTMKGKETFDPQGPLHIEKPEKETMLRIEKGVYKWVSHKYNSLDIHNYSIFEDLS
jgi:hypothetical protein